MSTVGFHITEACAEVYLQNESGTEFLQLARRLHDYLQQGQRLPARSLFEATDGCKEISREAFDALAKHRMENTGEVSGLFELDFDARTFSALNIMDGWKRFRIQDVSTAVYFATKKSAASPDEQWRTFLDRLQGKEITYETEPQYLTGIRTLHAEDISFAEDIIQNDNLLEFYMEVSFHADEVFGTNVCTTENDDWLNIYANYDLDARRVCDTLEVYLQRGNGDEEAFKYRLSAEEQALLLPRMNTYCQEYWGQSLEECSANYLSEQSPASPEMQM